MGAELELDLPLNWQVQKIAGSVLEGDGAQPRQVLAVLRFLA